MTPDFKTTLPYIGLGALGLVLSCDQPTALPGLQQTDSVVQALKVDANGDPTNYCDKNEPLYYRGRAVLVPAGQDLLAALRTLGPTDQIILGPGRHQLPDLTNVNPGREIRIYGAPDVLNSFGT